MQLLLAVVAFVFNSYLYPDAGRVAPISACVSSSTKCYHQAQPQNANSNGGDASCVGKICSYYLAGAVFPSFIYPDAGRVAPISACVSSSTKCYHQAQPQNANSNGGDASRVGKICSYD